MCFMHVRVPAAIACSLQPRGSPSARKAPSCCSWQHWCSRAMHADCGNAQGAAGVLQQACGYSRVQGRTRAGSRGHGSCSSRQDTCALCGVGLQGSGPHHGHLLVGHVAHDRPALGVVHAHQRDHPPLRAARGRPVSSPSTAQHSELGAVSGAQQGGPALCCAVLCCGAPAGHAPHRTGPAGSACRPPCCSASRTPSCPGPPACPARARPGCQRSCHAAFLRRWLRLTRASRALGCQGQVQLPSGTIRCAAVRGCQHALSSSGTRHGPAVLGQAGAARPAAHAMRRHLPAPETAHPSSQARLHTLGPAYPMSLCPKNAHLGGRSADGGRIGSPGALLGTVPGRLRSSCLCLQTVERSRLSCQRHSSLSGLLASSCQQPPSAAM